MQGVSYSCLSNIIKSWTRLSMSTVTCNECEDSFTQRFIWLTLANALGIMD